MDLSSNLRKADSALMFIWALGVTRLAALIAGFALWVPLSATPCRAEAPRSLVATTEVRPQSFRMTLPDKVGVLLAGEERALAFEIGGRLESDRGIGE